MCLIQRFTNGWLKIPFFLLSGSVYVVCVSLSLKLFASSIFWNLSFRKEEISPPSYSFKLLLPSNIVFFFVIHFHPHWQSHRIPDSWTSNRMLWSYLLIFINQLIFFFNVVHTYLIVSFDFFLVHWLNLSVWLAV